MQLECLDHVHFAVPDLQRAKAIYGPFLGGAFVPDYGGPELNAYGGWNTSGGDFIQPIDPEAPVFGGPPMPHQGLLSVSFRVADVDVGIDEARAAGLVVRSRVGSEDIGLGKNVVQAQLEPEPVSRLPFELVEHQLPDVVAPLTETAVDHVEMGGRRGARRLRRGALADSGRALRGGAAGSGARPPFSRTPPSRASPDDPGRRGSSGRRRDLAARALDDRLSLRLAGGRRRDRGTRPGRRR